MKIGIDAKWLFSGHISGKLFIQNVLPELFSLHPEIEWHIFLNKKDKNLELPFPGKNIKVHYVWAKFNMLSNLFVLPRYARKLHLDVVLFQTFSVKSKKFKSVVFIHDILFETYPQYFTWKERIYFKPIKWTAPLADRIITTTEFVKKELQQFKFIKNTQPVDIAPSGVTFLFKPAKEHRSEVLAQIKTKYNLPDTYLLFTGRLNARKNIEGLIKALPLVNDKNISIVIVGETNWKAPQLSHLLSNSKIKDRIIFTGKVTDEDLAAIYATAKIFCFLSFAEGFGLPPLEAMASGVPVVVSNTTSMPEVCGNAALFTDPHNVNDIAQKVNMLLTNNEFFQEKIKVGLKWSSQYTWKRTAEGIMKGIFAAVNV